MKNLSLYIIVLFCYCNNNKASKDSEENTQAKWFFYCYANSLNAKINGVTEINPLKCGLQKLTEKNIGNDTIKIYFTAFYKDSLSVINFEPLHLAGVCVVRDKIYLPIYHSIVYDEVPDSVTLKIMYENEAKLIQNIEKTGEDVEPWLYDQAKKRHISK